jgi:hypothetical protein
MTADDAGRRMNTLPIALREMIEHGLHLFPCHAAPDGRCDCGVENCPSPGKHPWVKNWQALATTDQEQIARWQVRYPGCNWGVATGMKSGVVVLDVDPRHGGDESLANLPELQPTWTCRTPSGGWHNYYRHPGVGPINNSAGVVGPGLDIRGDGGFAVGPPSANGRLYAWDVDLHPDDTTLADLPDWILARIDRPHVAAGATPLPVPPEEWCRRVAEEVPEGKRTNRLAQLAGYLLRKRIDPYVALELLLGWNSRSCRPPLEEAEVVATVTSIITREAKRREDRDAA